MDRELAQQILDDLILALEPLDAQNTALMQFLKSKKIITDEEFAPFLEQAGKAASVRWTAVRVRASALLAKAMEPEEKPSGAEAKKGDVDANKDDAKSVDASADKGKGKSGEEQKNNSAPEKKDDGAAVSKDRDGKSTKETASKQETEAGSEIKEKDAQGEAGRRVEEPNASVAGEQAKVGGKEKVA